MNKVKIETKEVVGPAYWAVYLINGDASIFDYLNTPNDNAGDREQKQCDKWFKRVTQSYKWYVVDASDSEFRHDMGGGTGLSGDACTYTFIKR